MNYETFLFTRNQQRDFTAFIRPKELTNKEISTIASALGNVNDVSDLSAEWPALYCFPIGEYILLLRHYDSGRKHAGRNIPLLEGIAVKRTRARHFAAALPHFLAHQAELLAIAVPDIETQTVQESPDIPWPNVQAAEAVEGAADDTLVNEFVARLTEDRLFIPFNPDGRAMLIDALSDPRFPSLYFAFGTNSDVLARLNKAEIDVDIVSYFNTTVPSLRSRVTNEITSELTGYTPKPPKTRTKTREPEPLAADAPAPMRPPRTTPKNSQDDTLKHYDTGEDAMLTPRQMARKAQETEQQEAAEREKPESVFGWLGGLIARLLGRK